MDHSAPIGGVCPPVNVHFFPSSLCRLDLAWPTAPWVAAVRLSQTPGVKVSSLRSRLGPKFGQVGGTQEAPTAVGWRGQVGGRSVFGVFSWPGAGQIQGGVGINGFIRGTMNN